MDKSSARIAQAIVPAGEECLGEANVADAAQCTPGSYKYHHKVSAPNQCSEAIAKILIVVLVSHIHRVNIDVTTASGSDCQGASETRSRTSAKRQRKVCEENVKLCKMETFVKYFSLDFS